MTNNNETAFKSAQYNYDNQIPEEDTIACSRCGRKCKYDDVDTVHMGSSYMSDAIENICDICVIEILEFANKKIRRD